MLLQFYVCVALSCLELLRVIGMSNEDMISKRLILSVGKSIER